MRSSFTKALLLASFSIDCVVGEKKRDSVERGTRRLHKGGNVIYGCGGLYYVYPMEVVVNKKGPVGATTLRIIAPSILISLLTKWVEVGAQVSICRFWGLWALLRPRKRIVNNVSQAWSGRPNQQRQKA